MKKAVLWVAAALAILFCLYAVLSGLVNQGHSPLGAVLILSVLGLGVLGLIRIVRK